MPPQGYPGGMPPQGYPGGYPPQPGAPPAGFMPPPAYGQQPGGGPPMGQPDLSGKAENRPINLTQHGLFRIYLLDFMSDDCGFSSIRIIFRYSSA